MKKNLKEKEEKKTDLKDNMLSDDNLRQVSGGLYGPNGLVKCPVCGNENVLPYPYGNDPSKFWCNNKHVFNL